MKSFIVFISNNWEIWFLGLLNMIAAASWQYILRMLKNERKNNDAIMQGTKALLRGQLLNLYNHYYEDQKYCPIYALENIDELYQYYQKLGGNGAITKLVEKLKKLPTSKEDCN